MDLQLFSRNLNELEIITDACLNAVNDNDLTELDTLLAKRKDELEIIENLLKDHPTYFKDEDNLNSNSKFVFLDWLVDQPVTLHLTG